MTCYRSNKESNASCGAVRPWGGAGTSCWDPLQAESEVNVQHLQWVPQRGLGRCELLRRGSACIASAPLLAFGLRRSESCRSLTAQLMALRYRPCSAASAFAAIKTSLDHDFRAAVWGLLWVRCKVHVGAKHAPTPAVWVAARLQACTENGHLTPMRGPAFKAFGWACLPVRTVAVPGPMPCPCCLSPFSLAPFPERQRQKRSGGSGAMWPFGASGLLCKLPLRLRFHSP